MTEWSTSTDYFVKKMGKHNLQTFGYVYIIYFVNVFSNFFLKYINIYSNVCFRHTFCI